MAYAAFLKWKEIFESRSASRGYTPETEAPGLMSLTGHAYPAPCFAGVAEYGIPEFGSGTVPRSITVPSSGRPAGGAEIQRFQITDSSKKQDAPTRQ